MVDDLLNLRNDFSFRFLSSTVQCRAVSECNLMWDVVCISNSDKLEELFMILIHSGGGNNLVLKDELL